MNAKCLLLLLLPLLGASLRAETNDLVFTGKSGDITHALIVNFEKMTTTLRGKQDNGNWQTFYSRRIVEVDRNSAYMNSRNCTEVKLDDGYTSFLLMNDLSRVQYGQHYYYPAGSLTFAYSSSGRDYKYVLNLAEQTGGYYTGSGGNWQQLSSFKITGVKDEGQAFRGTPVLSLHFRGSNGVSNKLLISPNWDKIGGANNQWFLRSN